jgi:2-C-methyl-D-erythritol 4-phosphate cytidylyltransferase
MGGIKKEYQLLKESREQRAKNREQRAESREQRTEQINNESCFPVTVLGAAVCAFASVASVNTIVITIPENGEAAAREAIPKEFLERNKPKILFVTGGKTRQVSVFNALSCLVAHKPQYVLIHDGARPWISLSLINELLDAVKKYNAVIPLLLLTDTPKELESQTVYIITHLKRANTGIAQTPQCFKFPEILHAHIKAMETHDEEFTDDAEIWSRFCGKVAFIPGDPKNRKITYQGDIY